MVHFVEKLMSVRPYRLTLLFNTGEVRMVDLESFLREKAGTSVNAYQMLLDPRTFCRARFDPESRTVCWDGLAREITTERTEQPAPLDLCPDVLYRLSTPLPREHMPNQQHPRPAASNLVLKDEPPRNAPQTPARG
jgi:hypothetical protein